MSRRIIALVPVTVHQTRTGRVSICERHESALQQAQDAGEAPPAWYEELGLYGYLGVHRAPHSDQRRVCDACLAEAAAELGLRHCDVTYWPHDDERGTVSVAAD